MKELLRKWLRKMLRWGLYLLAVFFLSSLSYAFYLLWFRPFTTPTMVLRGLKGPSNHTADWHFDSRWRSLDQISESMQLAVIASEDQNFASHNGFDMEAIEKALKHNSKSKRVRGASTISQQVAKNVFLWPSRTWLRKGLEVYFTVVIETIWPKKRILEMYLNVAETGDGMFGVEAAAHRYYGVNASQLNQQQAAMIAAVLPNPVLYSATHPIPKMRRKQARVIRFMHWLGNDYLDEIRRGGKPPQRIIPEDRDSE